MVNLNNILFLDIETVSQHDTLSSASEEWQKLWHTKAENLKRHNADADAESLYNRAGIYAEFGKIICISCGVIQGSGTEKKLVIKSFCCEEEKDLLQDFSEMLCKWAPDHSRFLCAHNGKEFDFPYLCRSLYTVSNCRPALILPANALGRYLTLIRWISGNSEILKTSPH